MPKFKILKGGISEKRFLIIFLSFDTLLEEESINDILDQCEQICMDFSQLDTKDSHNRTTSRRPSTASVTSSSSQQGEIHFTTTSWTIEATLIRELGIRFIDARQLSTQAKLKLGVKGYPSLETKLKCVELAIEIFNAKSARDQTVMQCLKTGLDSAKQEVNVTIPDVTIKAFGGNKDRSSRKSNIRRTSSKTRRPTRPFDRSTQVLLLLSITDLATTTSLSITFESKKDSSKYKTSEVLSSCF